MHPWIILFLLVLACEIPLTGLDAALPPRTRDVITPEDVQNATEDAQELARQVRDLLKRRRAHRKTDRGEEPNP